MALRIRQEQPQDEVVVFEINASAFSSESEANLVSTLRKQEPRCISIVAESDGVILGHLMLSPVTLHDTTKVTTNNTTNNTTKLELYGLAPMAVHPNHQNQGIGSALVKEGLRLCKAAEIDAVVVLGHPEFYPRFGFTPSSGFNIVSEFDVPEEVFMILEIKKGVLDEYSGTIKYHSAFSQI